MAIEPAAHVRTLALVEQALYEDRTVVRMLAMCRTLFTVAVEDAPLLNALQE